MITRVVEFIVVGAMGLFITLVLFRFLDAWAEGKGAFLGTTVKFGGALAGWVVVTVVLLTVWDRVATVRTSINLDGDWDIVLEREDGVRVMGQAHIHQRRDEPRIHVTGTITTEKKPGYVTFSTKSGTISDRAIHFVYVNSRGEEGLANGQILEDTPNAFTVQYRDAHESDRNGDPQGLMHFSRRTDQ